jgi:HPt (histidine-containing phosphotransfer) domain-containing protein
VCSRSQPPTLITHRTLVRSTAKDLAKLSSLGHFLKGSSAALGVSKVQASCEQVQHYGDLRDEDAGRDLSPPEALAKIDVTLKRVKVEYAAAEKWLKEYYKGLGAGEDPAP